MHNGDQNIFNNRTFLICGIIVCFLFLLYDIYCVIKGDYGQLLGIASVIFLLLGLIVQIKKSYEKN